MKDLSLEELSNAYCLAVANAYRLIEDAEKVFPTKRVVSIVALLAAAVREMARVHLITKAVTFPENGKKEWSWFWKLNNDNSALIEYLVKEIHPHVFRKSFDAERVRPMVLALKENFIEVEFDEKRQKYVPPGSSVFKKWDEKVYAKEVYEYALALCKSLNIHGLPDPVSQYKLFAHLKFSTS